MGGGQTGALIQAHDWSATPLGPPSAWSPALRTAVSLLLTSAGPVYVAWGPELTSLYNDGYVPILGSKHPGIGLPFAELWSDIWTEFRPIVEETMAGHAQHFVDLPIALAGRPGLPEGFFTFSYTPLVDERGVIAGFYCAATETTERVLEERRQGFLARLEATLREIEDPVAMMGEATAALGQHLAVAQVGFGEIDDAQTHVEVCRDWNDGRIPSVVGTWRMDDFGPEFIAGMKAGITAVIPDVRSDPRTADPAVVAAYDGISTRSILDVPLLRGGRLGAMLFIHHPEVRAWTAAEVTLAQDVITRLGSAVERARAERAHARAASLALAQSRVLELAVSDASLGDALEAIVETVEGVSTSGVLASILLLDADGTHLRHGAAPSLPAAYNEAIDGIAVGPGVGSCGKAVHTGGPVFVSDIANDPLWADFKELAAEHGLGACWSIPIRSSQGALLGTFAMYHREPRAPTGDDFAIIEFVVRTAGLVIDRANAEHATRRSEGSGERMVKIVR